MGSSDIVTSSYTKDYSFKDLYIPRPLSSPSEQEERGARLLESRDTLDNAHIEQVFDDIKKQLLLSTTKDQNLRGAQQYFSLNPLVSEELSRLDDNDALTYLFHRYRYEVFPKKYILDDYPPCVQIEPSSICNLRCKFCYQTDQSFSKRSSGFMGTMQLDLFREIIDKIVGRVHFLTLASRGEPLLCKDFPQMMEYCKGKFLSLKINTNALLLTEQILESIFSSDVGTLVLSIDSSDPKTYEALRVNARFSVLEERLRLIQRVKERHKDCKTIVRISGVFVDKSQSLDDMSDKWGDSVDQLVFVKYNPWENVYNSPQNDIKAPCSDLWRRVFIWNDGGINCCDTDYKSTLLQGQSLIDSDLKSIWRSERYSQLREEHLAGERRQISPCMGCSLI